jgi:hypothetical protein
MMSQIQQMIPAADPRGSSTKISQDDDSYRRLALLRWFGRLSGMSPDKG